MPGSYGESPVELVQAGVRQSQERAQIATDLAPVEADTAVLSRAEDEPPVRAEGCGGEAFVLRPRVAAAHVEIRPVAVPLPQPDAARPSGHDPLSVGTERAAQDGPGVTDERVETRACANLPRLHDRACREEKPSVRADKDVR